MKHKLENIIIPEAFINSTPSPDKIAARSKEFRETGKMRGRVVINENNVLIDGYIAYLIYKDNNFDSIDVIYEASYLNNETMYVFGHHPNNKNEYVWRVARHKKSSAFKDINIGDTVLVHSKNKLAPVIVTKMQMRSTPPVNGRIKKVVYWNLDKKEEVTA